MKKTSCVAAVVASFLLLSLTACDLLFGGNKGNSSSSKNTDVDNAITGPLTTPATWKGKDDSGNPITYYINETYTIQNGGSLTIEEGAIVKFGSNGGIRANNESLTATGVIFTSWRDSRGRKIQAAGTTDPAPGDWKHIYIYGGTAKFESCEFSYGGSTGSTVEVVKGSNSILGKARINNCTFKNNNGVKSKPSYSSSDMNAALKYGSSCIYNSENNNVTNTSFENNVWPISVPPTFPVSPSNTFSDNEYEFVFINDETIDRDTVWNYLPIPYLFVSSSNKLTIKENVSFTINGGKDDNDVGTDSLITKVCFTNAGISIPKNSTLNVNDYVTFSNYPGSDNDFGGIYCTTFRKWLKSGTTSNYPSTNTIMLTSSSTVKIENYQVSGNYETDPTHYTATIKAVNNYNAFSYDESKN